MGASTKIAWARSSWNPWIGCTRVSPGCDHCYAEALDRRHRYGGATHWGPGVPRHRTSAGYWTRPLQWDRIAEMERRNGSCVSGSGRRGKSAMGIPAHWSIPGFWPVFPSLCDPFDNEVPREWFIDFLGLIHSTPNLTYLLLTKRIGNAARMIADARSRDDGRGAWPWPNVWLGASIVNQEEADRDIPKLLATPAAKRFVSYEPALGPVDFSQYLNANELNKIDGGPRIDQIIVGGESLQGGAKARPFNIEWARSTVRQCKDAGVACFVKQLGSHCIGRAARIGTLEGYRDVKLPFSDRAGADPSEWVSDLRVQEFPAR